MREDEGDVNDEKRDTPRMSLFGRTTTHISFNSFTIQDQLVESMMTKVRQFVELMSSRANL